MKTKHAIKPQDFDGYTFSNVIASCSSSQKQLAVIVVPATKDITYRVVGVDTDELLTDFQTAIDLYNSI